MLRANSSYSNSLAVLFGVESLVFWAAVIAGGLLVFEGKAYWGQYAVIHACLALGLYAFRGYDPARLKNRYEALISSFQGTLFGGILAVSLLMTQFPRIPRPYFIPAFLAYATTALAGRAVVAGRLFPGGKGPGGAGRGRGAVERFAFGNRSRPGDRLRTARFRDPERLGNAAHSGEKRREQGRASGCGGSGCPCGSRISQGLEPGGGEGYAD